MPQSSENISIQEQKSEEPPLRNGNHNEQKLGEGNEQYEKKLQPFLEAQFATVPIHTAKRSSKKLSERSKKKEDKKKIPDESTEKAKGEQKQVLERKKETTTSANNSLGSQGGNDQAKTIEEEIAHDVEEISEQNDGKEHELVPMLPISHVEEEDYVKDWKVGMEIQFANATSVQEVKAPNTRGTSAKKKDHTTSDDSGMVEEVPATVATITGEKAYKQTPVFTRVPYHNTNCTTVPPPPPPDKHARNDYYVVTTKLANSEQDPNPSSAGVVRAAVHSSAFFGGNRNNVSLRTEDWVLDTVLQSPNWLIRIARRALGDRISGATVSPSGREGDPASKEHLALFLSAGASGREALLLFNNSPTSVDPHHIPRVRIGACVLNSSDLEGKQEKDVLLEQVGLVLPNDLLFEHVAWQYARGENEVFIYLITETIPSFMNRRKTGKRGRVSEKCDVYRLWVYGEYPGASAVIEKLSRDLEDDESQPEVIILSSKRTKYDDRVGYSSGARVVQKKDRRRDMEVVTNNHPREDEHLQARSQQGVDEVSNVSEVAADVKRADTVGSRHLNHVHNEGTRQHEKGESSSASVSVEEEVESEQVSNGGEEEESEEQEIITSTRDEEASDASHTLSVESTGESDGDADGVGDDDIQWSADRLEENPSIEEEHGGSLGFYPREIILLHHTFVGIELKEKEKKWLSFDRLNKINQKDVVRARWLLKLIDMALIGQPMDASTILVSSKLLLTSKTTPKSTNKNDKLSDHLLQAAFLLYCFKNKGCPSPVILFNAIANALARDFRALPEPEIMRWCNTALERTTMFESWMDPFDRRKEIQNIGTAKSLHDAAIAKTSSPEADRSSDYVKMKAKKDPNTPKKFGGPFILYYSHVYDEVRAENPDLSIPEMARLIGSKYRSLSVEELKPWKKAAAEDKARYHREIVEFNQKKRDEVVCI